MITVDITSRNNIFNPLSGQGSWIQHRFGQRNYPIYDLEISIVDKIFKQHKQVFFRSVFGDPLCHPNIEQIINSAKEQSVNLIIFSYLNNNIDHLIENIKHSNISIFVPVDGFNTYGKTLLETCYSTVYDNIKKLEDKVTVEYHLYNYNINEIETINEFCTQYQCGLKFQPGKSFGLPVTSIIDRYGIWLYDVIPLQNITDVVTDQRVLVKTVEGHQSLRNYIKPVIGYSILDKPAISKRLQTTKKFNDDMPAISVTGHIFNNTEEMYAFSNALCSDWLINLDQLITGSVIDSGLSGESIDEYSILIGATLNQILDRGLKSFSDSDV